MERTESNAGHVPRDHEADAGYERRRPESLDLRAQWEEAASDWIAWAREPMHDSYWRFHRDQFVEILPPPGERTLDLGSGEGRLSRDLKDRGHAVVSLDGSLTLARAADEEDSSIPVVAADAAAIPLQESTFDLVVAFMSLQDVEDLPRAVGEAARVLRPGGAVCLAIVHPLNSAGSFATRDPDSPFVVDGSYLESGYYVDEAEREGLPMTFASVHRPIQAYVGALAAAGLLVDELREPAVPDDYATSASGQRWQRIPLFLHLRAVRPS
jgi:SAM-dependent methyltransferase